MKIKDYKKQLNESIHDDSKKINNICANYYCL